MISAPRDAKSRHRERIAEDLSRRLMKELKGEDIQVNLPPSENPVVRAFNQAIAEERRRKVQELPNFQRPARPHLARQSENGNRAARLF